MTITNYNNLPDWVTSKQAREILACKKTKFFELIKYNQIEAKKIGRILLVNTKSLINYKELKIKRKDYI